MQPTQSKERITMPDHNNTTEIERILRQFELWLGLAKIGAVNSSAAEHTLNRKQATTQLQNLIIKERQEELAKTVLGGMGGLTPAQQDYITNRITALEKTLKESTDV